MSETLKNRPLQHIDFEGLTIDNIIRTHDQRKAVLKQLQDWQEWFEGFETKMLSFRDSQVLCVEWLQKYTMIDPLDTMKLMQVQAALRTFIEKEILGDV